MIKIEASNVKYAEEILADKPKQIKSAALAAINRTIKHVKSKISITVRKQYVVSAKDIKDTIHIERAKNYHSNTALRQPQSLQQRRDCPTSAGLMDRMAP